MVEKQKWSQRRTSRIRSVTTTIWLRDYGLMEEKHSQTSSSSTTTCFLLWREQKLQPFQCPGESVMIKVRGGWGWCTSTIGHFKSGVPVGVGDFKSGVGSNHKCKTTPTLTPTLRPTAAHYTRREMTQCCLLNARSSGYIHHTCPPDTYTVPRTSAGRLHLPPNRASNWVWGAHHNYNSFQGAQRFTPLHSTPSSTQNLPRITV